MKGLLHSKRFRKNLYRWLFMYVGVMVLFTTVVTYSRYISNFEGSDTSRVAKFEVGIKHKGCEGDISENNVCASGTFRPQSNIEYDFEVDTTKLEVAADFFLTIIVNDDFEIKGLQNLTTGQVIDISTFSNNRVTLEQRILAGKGGPVDYRLTVMYKYNDKIEGEPYTKPIVAVDYTAEQVD